MGYAAALAWLLFAVIMVVTALQVWGSRRFVYYEGNSRK
jgi:multiple sugar transport system permease protein